MDPWYAGNTDEDAHENREWLVGHFKAPDDVRHDTQAEVKVSRHEAGEERPNGRATGEQRRTHFMLIAGRPFEVTLSVAGEADGKTEVLSKPGDYLVWGPGTDHVWRAVGASQVATFRWLGLDSAVHAIGKALAAADRRRAQWQNALDKLPDVKAVEVDTLTKSFPGIGDHGGTFRGHLELAALAVALKRRVIVLQAVEHAQIDPGNPFKNFARALKADQQRLDKLESSIAGVLLRLSTLELARPRGLRSPVVTSGEVDRLLRTAYRIHALGDGVAVNNHATDMAIEIARNKDGSVVVLPALPA